MVAHFKNAQAGDEFFTFLPRVDGNKRIIFDLKRKKGAGESADDLTKPNSEYVAALKSISPQSHYLQFEVYTDSFATYLGPRGISGIQNFPVGWKPVYRVSVTDGTLRYWHMYDYGRAEWIAFRPKPKPTRKPAPPKKPANVLD